MLEREGGVELRVGARMMAELNQNGCWKLSNGERESGVEKRLRDEMRAELYQNGCWRERERGWT